MYVIFVSNIQINYDANYFNRTEAVFKSIYEIGWRVNL